MPHYCIKATTLDCLIDDRIKEVEDTQENIPFWFGYQAALEWLKLQVQPLLDYHQDYEDTSLNKKAGLKNV